MANIEVSTDEARLVSVFRAIKELNSPTLIEVEDVGDAVALLQQVLDLEKYEKSADAGQLKFLVLGFVAGLAASRISQLTQLEGELFDGPEGPVPAEYLDETVAGGRSGGVVAGQGKSDKYVAQTGVRKENEGS